MICQKLGHSFPQIIVPKINIQVFFLPIFLFPPSFRKSTLYLGMKDGDASQIFSFFAFSHFNFPFNANQMKRCHFAKKCVQQKISFEKTFFSKCFFLPFVYGRLTSQQNKSESQIWERSLCNRKKGFLKPSTLHIYEERSLISMRP